MRLLAALIFFTRLPFWRIREVPGEAFKHVVPYWSLTGWLTGGIMVLTLWVCSHFLPISTAWLLAMAVRLLITGCLHEDGLADFCDGFGGGTTRARTLEIMKDSHIGTYGVIGLIVYFLLRYQLQVLPVSELCAIAFCGDVWGKACASQVINLLPYARKEEDAKIKTTYQRMDAGELILSILPGLIPIVYLLPTTAWVAMPISAVIAVLLILLMKRRIQGYTGDCCGALFLICELFFCISCVVFT